MENNTNLELTPMERFGKFLAENLKPEVVEELLKEDAKTHPEENNPLDLLVKETLAEEANRLVVIDHRTHNRLENYGRIMDVWDVKIKFDLQDDNRTLKVFINDR